MARLSERDRRVLLGDSFDSLERQIAEQSSGPVTPEQERQRWGVKLERTKARLVDVGVIFIAGLIIAWGNHKTGQPQDWSVWFGLSVTLFGGGAFAWLVLQIGKLQRLLGSRSLAISETEMTIQHLVRKTVISEHVTSPL